MAVKDSRGPCKRLLAFIMPPNSRGLCRTREKQLFILALGTISFLCFGSIWFLPEKPGPGGKVKVVRDKLQAEVENLILPPPPEDVGGDVNINPNIRHGVIDKPDPHKLEEKAHLDAQIELDEEIKRIRKNQEQQVLAKPSFDKEKDSKKSSSSSPEALDNKFAKPDQKPDEVVKSNSDEPKIQGGEDPDATAKERRDHVKGVSIINSIFKIFLFCFVFR